jgi:hypothetical protein
MRNDRTILAGMAAKSERRVHNFAAFEYSNARGCRPKSRSGRGLWPVIKARFRKYSHRDDAEIE